MLRAPCAGLLVKTLMAGLVEKMDFGTVESMLEAPFYSGVTVTDREQRYLSVLLGRENVSLVHTPLMQNSKGVAVATSTTLEPLCGKKQEAITQDNPVEQ